MKVSIIGTGFGERVMAPIYRDLGFEVQVASPRDAEAVKRACAAEVDLVSIHSPPFQHHEQVMAALEAGRAVLCDKPFGRSAAEARAMRDRARALGALNFLNFEFRHQPGRVKVRQLIADGAIGALQHVNWSFIGGGLRRGGYRWIFDRELGGGWIGAYGSHMIDSLRWWFGGEVADCGAALRIEVPSRTDRAGAPHAVTAEDGFAAWFRMDRGGTVAIDSTFSAAASLPQRVVLTGEAGVIELIDDVTVVVRRADGSRETLEFPPPPGDVHAPALAPWLAEVKAALQAGKQIAPSFDDGVAVAEVMDRLRAGAAPA